MWNVDEMLVRNSVEKYINKIDIGKLFKELVIKYVAYVFW